MKRTPGKLRNGTYTMEVTLWNLHNGSYLMERTPWTLPHGTYTMEVTYWNLHLGSYLV